MLGFSFLFFLFLIFFLNSVDPYSLILGGCPFSVCPLALESRCLPLHIFLGPDCNSRGFCNRNTNVRFTRGKSNEIYTDKVRCYLEHSLVHCTTRMSMLAVSSLISDSDFRPLRLPSILSERLPLVPNSAILQPTQKRTHQQQPSYLSEC
jgi:hypothetical protein